MLTVTTGYSLEIIWSRKERREGKGRRGERRKWEGKGKRKHMKFVLGLDHHEFYSSFADLISLQLRSPSPPMCSCSECPVSVTMTNDHELLKKRRENLWLQLAKLPSTQDALTSQSISTALQRDHNTWDRLLCLSFLWIEQRMEFSSVTFLSFHCHPLPMPHFPDWYNFVNIFSLTSLRHVH